MDNVIIACGNFATERIVIKILKCESSSRSWLWFSCAWREFAINCLVLNSRFISVNEFITFPVWETHFLTTLLRPARHFTFHIILSPEPNWRKLPFDVANSDCIEKLTGNKTSINFSFELFLATKNFHVFNQTQSAFIFRPSICLVVCSYFSGALESRRRAFNVWHWQAEQVLAEIERKFRRITSGSHRKQ